MLEKFMEWLNNEIEKLSFRNNNEYIMGELAMARIIRQRLCEMDAKNNETIEKDSLEAVADKICRRYCKFPEAYLMGRDDDNERMIEEKCNHCPLSEVIK